MVLRGKSTGWEVVGTKQRPRGSPKLRNADLAPADRQAVPPTLLGLVSRALHVTPPTLRHARQLVTIRLHGTLRQTRSTPPSSRPSEQPSSVIDCVTMTHDDRDDQNCPLRSSASSLSASQSTVKQAQPPASPTQQLSTPRSVRSKSSDESSITAAGKGKVSDSPIAHPSEPSGPSGPSGCEPGPSAQPQNAQPPPRLRPKTMRKNSKRTSHASSSAMARSSYDSSILSSLITESDLETEAAGVSTFPAN